MEKLLVAQRRQQQAGGNQNTALYFGFVLGLAWACGNNDGAIMIGHFLVRGLQPWFVATGLNDRRFRIVWNCDPGDAAEKVVGMAVARNPGGQLLIGKSLRVGFVAGSQYGYEDAGLCH